MRAFISILAASMIAASASAGEKTGPVPANTWGAGAQTELLGPLPSTSGMLASYDAGKLQFEATLAASILGPIPAPDSQTDAYSFGLRAYVPVHRAQRADFSLGVGATFYIFKPHGNSANTAWAFFVGARARIFVTSNVCVFGTLGGALAVQSGEATGFVGARPLGAAGFIYYFF